MADTLENRSDLRTEQEGAKKSERGLLEPNQQSLMDETAKEEAWTRRRRARRIARDADTESAAVAVAAFTEVERERLQKSLQVDLGQFTLVLISRARRLAAIVRQLVPRSTSG
jgi:hypothetical protein